ncbi:flagellar basal body L-ring protein FlgH [Pelagovum pacificum]|uniref:Flagellar L-ring protein n=1 Tax=Pelagovum pacificum TaxID=2588711 RepID=A0A5C5GIB6_9RHOB|nr:flagellar basal body L-ring protein FlgH [Pelagovum pacificum]QQA42978.1 flagellar basal body L-ring protein FlgH [Pelagovum pacificum]TNY33877.1 flagellar basal body L-ring protein FlgH [Pelagovum pacificum]
MSLSNVLSARVGLVLCLALAGCDQLSRVGRAPDISPARATSEHNAMMTYGLPLVEVTAPVTPPLDSASLWTGDRGSLLGDRRAVQRGDILTVVIEIDDSAEISNSTSRSRSGAESLALPQLLGIPQRLAPELPEGASFENAVSVTSSSSADGDGSVRRNERLELRVAATILDVMPNGVLSISGSQEVRVNNELRELLVSGFVRPEDITRQNEITYDKIASARISYGGRGDISDVQQPRYGQQAVDAMLPF